MMRGGKRNGAGRPKGSPNRTTDDLRQKVDLLINNNWDKLQNDIDQLSPKERIEAIGRLLEYSLPKLNRTELGGDSDNGIREIKIVRKIIKS